MNRFIGDIIREFPSFISHFFIIIAFIITWVILCGIVRYGIGAYRKSKGIHSDSH